MTKGIYVSSENKSFLYKQKIKQPKNFKLKKFYNKYVSIFKKVIKNAKILHEQRTEISKIKTTKDLWNYYNKKTGIKKGKKSQINSLKTESKIVTDETEIANVMNEYFCNVGKKVVQSIDEESETEDDVPSFSLEESFFLRPYK